MLETSPPAPTSSAARITLLLAAVGLLGACAAPRPQVRSIRLAATQDTIIAPYGEITDATWLGGGRWAVIAPQDRAVSVADFQRRSLTRFGGRQARELEQPFQLFRSGDSVYVADWLRRRLTGWSLEGVLGGERPAMDTYRGVLPRARDEAGRWYFENRAAPGRDGRGNLDSAAVLRASPDWSRADTVMRLAPLDLVEVVSDGGRRLERRLLSGQDRWGVLPDGALWVARVSQNRIDWRAPSGKITTGEALPDRVLPITQNDRDVFLNRFESGLRTTVSQIPFAAIKPPFDAALAAPEGLVWLVKNRAIGDTIRDYQVIDRAGRLVIEASHAGLGRILAMGGGYALVGEPFAAGVRLLLFRLPADTGSGGPSPISQ
jgi:hypothetical protein